MQDDCGADAVDGTLIPALRGFHPSVNHYPVGQYRGETLILKGDGNGREGFLQLFQEGIHPGLRFRRSPVHVDGPTHHKAGYCVALGVFFEIIYYLCRIDRIKCGCEYAKGVARGKAGALNPEVYSDYPVHFDGVELNAKIVIFMASDNTKSKGRRAFRFSLVDAFSHERLWSIRFTRTTLIVVVASSIVALLICLFCLIAFTPIRTFIPGYPDAHTRRQAVQNAMRIDSLETKILQWELWSENLRHVVAGEKPVRLDSLIRRKESSEASSADGAFLSSRDSLLRSQVASAEAFEISGEKRNLPIEAISFFTPLKGVISKEFDSAVHPWVDIAAPAQSMVLSTLDGTVVFSSWDEGSGYTIVLQHDGDLISVYKRNASLLKSVGAKVKAGTPVALVGSSESAGDHLHFELWYRGEAVDPALYIDF